MNEKIITLDSVEPVEIYGVNDVKLNIIQKSELKDALLSTK